MPFPVCFKFLIQFRSIQETEKLESEELILCQTLFIIGRARSILHTLKSTSAL